MKTPRSSPWLLKERRALALLLVLCLCLSGCRASAAKNSPGDSIQLMTDIQGHWAEKPIRYCLENGYMTGTSSTTFEPESIVTRAQVIQTLYNMAGSPSIAGMDCPFVDISEHWGRRAIVWAYNVNMAKSAGQLTDLGGLLFAPDQPMTREEMAVAYKSYREYSLEEPADLAGSYLERFTDRGLTSPQALPSVNWAVQTGVLSGTGPDTLSPQGTCTRAQLAQSIQNYYEPARSDGTLVGPVKPEPMDLFHKGPRNSPLVDYIHLSPNHSGRRSHPIDTITIHCMAGDLSVEQCGETFADPRRQASSNYAIGSDGRIALYVDEGCRSWCSSSAANDHRAVTIEVANIAGAPDWPVSSLAYASLIDLVTDICQRNGIKRLLWQGNKSLVGQTDKQNMTVHRWFADKSCPGNYLYNRHGDIAEQVNKRLAAAEAIDSMQAAEEALHAGQTISSGIQAGE